jgi:hypothetical protein|tara:strand:- start:130 stop:390 length:261 start_codon:yes stop_codon:yes gene_type:complete
MLNQYKKLVLSKVKEMSEEKMSDHMLSLILSTIDRNADCKIVWGEGDKEKVGRGKITADDDNFVFLVGERGKVIVNKHNIIAIKQM